MLDKLSSDCVVQKELILQNRRTRIGVSEEENQLEQSFIENSGTGANAHTCRAVLPWSTYCTHISTGKLRTCQPSIQR
jgi:hypothetical protein